MFLPITFLGVSFQASTSPLNMVKTEAQSIGLVTGKSTMHIITEERLCADKTDVLSEALNPRGITHSPSPQSFKAMM